MSKIIQLYKDILSTGNLVADKDGFISAQMGGSTVPFSVDNKRMVLPLREQLTNPDWENRIVFHPLSENFLRDESVVMGKFRNAINIRLNYVLGLLMSELFTLVLSVDEHKKMTPDQASLLTKIKDIDEKTVSNFTSILKNMGLGNKDKCFVYIFLKRSGHVRGKSYNRAAIVHFPLYEELKKKEKAVYGVTLRARDREAYISMLEYLIPGIDVDNNFDRGSESDIAPFLDALMKGLIGIAGNINSVVRDYESYLSDSSKFLYNDEWVDIFDNLSQMLPDIRAIPMQAGNEGPAAVVKQNAPTLAINQPNTLPVQVVNQPMVNTTGQCHQPASGPVLTASGGIDFAATLRGNPVLNSSYSYQNAPQMSGPAALRNAPMCNPGGFSGGYQQPQMNQWPQQMQQQRSFGSI